MDTGLQIIGLSYKSLVSLEVNPKDKSEFYPFIEQIPNVLECDCITAPTRCC